MFNQEAASNLSVIKCESIIKKWNRFKMKNFIFKNIQSGGCQQSLNAEIEGAGLPTYYSYHGETKWVC